MVSPYYPSRTEYKKQFTPDSGKRFLEMDRLDRIVTSKLALQPTKEMPGSPMKIIILSRRYEFGGARFTDGLCLDEDCNGRE